MWNLSVISHQLNLYYYKLATNPHVPLCTSQSTTVPKFKNLVHDRCGVPPDEQRLIFAGKQLDDDKNLGDYSTLGNRATLFLVLRLPGGSGGSYIREVF